MSSRDHYYLAGVINAVAAGVNAALYAGAHEAPSLGAAVFCGLSSLGLFARAAA